MIDSRLIDYLDHMTQAIELAVGYVRGMERPEFLADRRTQQAVIFNLIVLGEAATKILDAYAEFAAKTDAIPWASMKGMRNRIAHGYFDIDLDIVWETVQSDLPALLESIREISKSSK
jgi:uncharacterized protein with HEPN domain